MKDKILIDIQGLQSMDSSHRGVGRYTKEVVKRIIEMSSEQYDYHLLFNSRMKNDRKYIESTFGNTIAQNKLHAMCWLPPSDFTNNRKNYIAARIFREAIIALINPSIVFSTNMQEGFIDGLAITGISNADSRKYVTVLHDLVPLYFYKEYLGDRAQRDWYFEKITESMKSDRLVTVSKEAFEDISSILGCETDRRLSWIYNGCNESFSLIGRKNPKVGELTRFIYYGGTDKHKNIEIIFDAINLLAGSVKGKSEFLFVGKDFEPERSLYFKEKITLGSKIKFIGYLSDDDLSALLKESDCLIFPAIKEGFGLPIVEAMASGLAVLASNTTTGRELLVNDDLLFNPYDPKDLAQKITRMVESSSALYDAKLYCRNQFSLNGFSWDAVSTHLISIFESLCGEPGKKVVRHVCRSDIFTDFVALCKEKGITFTFDECRAIVDSFTLSTPGSPDTIKQRLFVDLSVIHSHDHKTGIQRVSRALYYNLQLVYDGEVIPIYSNDLGKSFFVFDSLDDNYRAPIDVVPVSFNPGDILILVDLHPGLTINLYDSSAAKYIKNLGTRIYHVVYDLLPALQPDKFWPELISEFRAWLSSIHNSSGVLCISKSVADELYEYYCVTKSKENVELPIHWFHLGSDINNSAPTRGLPADTAEVFTRLRACPSFLMVGTIEPRKAYSQTLAGFDELWAKGSEVNLVIVGKEGWNSEVLLNRLRNHPERGRHLFWLEQTSDEYLEKVYNASTCLIAASYGEGFGLPLIEAARHGLPLLVRDIPVFREVTAGHAHFFADQPEPLTISEAVETWLEQYRQGKHQRSDAMPHQTWKESAHQVLNAILGTTAPYKTWLPDGVRHYPDSDPRLHTDVGKRG
ncbi:glycosyltransferase family 1 protein [Acidithiobacillus ferrianus]|uniref:Glycosyltransferase n=2 Tax=Acidithiobacillus ferrianus TaxID=2678518 RepID=A0A845UGM0_9PROT|nr:glycosyltransferase family 1 protein [Acidithiobacillus ferrianus]NDU43720.1 glycosyltransferase [Acidithiobacillus ferrianus]